MQTCEIYISDCNPVLLYSRNTNPLSTINIKSLTMKVLIEYNDVISSKAYNNEKLDTFHNAIGPGYIP